MAHHLSPELPLYGIPVCHKDNIDLAGTPATCGCPEFAFTPPESSTIVSRLFAAGAIPIGKTNLDQLATGLNGTRSPYGAPRSVFNSDYISGGSSSGSAVAVASGTVGFSLGTDTAGSGRVPAAFNHIVGYKPTKGPRSYKRTALFSMSAQRTHPDCRGRGASHRTTAQSPANFTQRSIIAHLPHG